MASDRNLQQEERLATVRSAIDPVLRARAVELADLAWVTEHGALTLRVTIERPLPEGTVWRPELGFGVNLDDCADVSRDISAVLDPIDDQMPEAYALEVSSPGLDRPLYGARDFVRFVGATVKVKLAKPAADGQRLLRGSLLEANAGRIAVLVDGRRIEAPIEDVADANLVFELVKGVKAGSTSGPKAAKTKGAVPPESRARAAKPKRASGSSAS